MYWYAVYTKPRWEKKVANLLTQKRIVNYCPVQTVIKVWTDRKKKIEQPLLPSYVFVKASTEEEKEEIRRVDGIVNFVYWLNKPAVIKDVEIKRLIEFTEKHAGSDILMEQLELTKGSKMVIETGIFKGKKATIKEVKKDSIEFVLDDLGIRLVVNKAR
jgi:transcription antitermination factor NusG